MSESEVFEKLPDWLPNYLLKRVLLLEQRIVALEKQVRCTHLFKRYADYLECVHCNQRLGV